MDHHRRTISGLAAAALVLGSIGVAGATPARSTGSTSGQLDPISVPIASDAADLVAAPGGTGVLVTGALDHLVIRLGPNGQRDISYAAPARSTLGDGVDLAARPSGGALVATGSHLVALRTDGSIDPAFGKKGVITARVVRVAATADALFTIEGGSDLALVRRDPVTGAPDQRFGTGGRVNLTNWSNYDVDLAVASGDRAVVLLGLPGETSSVRRYLASGKLDSSFSAIRLGAGAWDDVHGVWRAGRVALDAADRVWVAQPIVSGLTGWVALQPFGADGRPSASPRRVDVHPGASEIDVPYALVLSGTRLAMAMAVARTVRASAAGDVYSPSTAAALAVIPVDGSAGGGWAKQWTVTVGSSDRFSAAAFAGGAVVAAGAAGIAGGTSDATVVEATLAGTFDTGYGTGGSVVLHLTTSDDRACLPCATSDADPRPLVAITPDGALVLATPTQGEGGDGLAGTSTIVERITPAGHPDPGFGSNGAVVLENFPLRAMAIDSAGRIALFGIRAGYPVGVTLSATGAVGAIGTGEWQLFGWGMGNAIALPDGTFVVAGYAVTVTSIVDDTGGLWRYRPGGAPEGFAWVDASWSETTAVTATATGALVADTGPEVAGLVRWSATGTPDPSFHTATTLSGPLAALSDGSVVAADGVRLARVGVTGATVAGFARPNVPGGIAGIGTDGRDRIVVLAGDGSVRRYLANGSPDRSFGSGGAVRLTGATLDGLAVASGGTVVVRGCKAGTQWWWRLNGAA